MSGFRQPEIPRQQIVLWSQRLEDMIPPDHPVRAFDELLELPDFAKVVQTIADGYRLQDGRPPFHPRFLVRLYIYGMLNRLRSSRQLERACSNNLEVLWLMHGQRPDHSTIAAFLTTHAAALKDLLRASAKIGIEVGLIDLRNAAIDGTKIEANAGVGSVRNEQTLKEMETALEKEIAGMEAEFGRSDRQETLAFADGVGDEGSEEGGGNAGGSEGGGGVVAAARNKLARLHESQKAIQRRRDQAPPEGATPKAVASTTDPDSRVMMDKEGRSKPNYNAHAAVDTKAGMIVATDVNDQPNDSGQLAPLLEEIKATTGRLPEAVLADAGYSAGRDVKDVIEADVLALVASRNTKTKEPAAAAAVAAVREGRTLTLTQINDLPRTRGRFSRESFIYDAAADTYRCPAGQTLKPTTIYDREDRFGLIKTTRYATKECRTCPYSTRCCGDPQEGRDINRSEFERYLEQTQARMNSDENKERFKLRGQTVEPRFGTIKSVLGVRKFLRRGLANVRAEFQLACLAINVGILLRKLTAGPRPPNPAAA